MWILLIDDSTDYHGEFSRLMKACGVDYSSLDQAVDLQEGLRLLAERAYDFCFIGGKFAEPGVVEAIRASSIPHIVVLAEGDGITLPYDEAAATWVDKAAVTSRMLGLVLREALRTAVELRAARESERLFRMTEEATGIGTWNWNLKTDELTWSPNLYRLVGLQPGEQADRLYDHWLSVMHPDDREAAEASAISAIETRSQVRTLFRIHRPASAPGGPPELRWIASTGEVLRDADDAPVRLIGINIDVTDQQLELASLRAKKTELIRQRQASEVRFRTYFDASPDLMFYVKVEPEGRFIYEAVNPAGMAMFAMTPEQFIGRTPEQAHGPERGAEIMDGLRTVLRTGDSHRFSRTWETPRGRRSYDVVYLPMRDEDGAIVSVLGMGRDVTERDQERA